MPTTAVNSKLFHPLFFHLFTVQLLYKLPLLCASHISLLFLLEYFCFYPFVLHVISLIFWASGLITSSLCLHKIVFDTYFIYEIFFLLTLKNVYNLTTDFFKIVCFLLGYTDVLFKKTNKNL